MGVEFVVSFDWYKKEGQKKRSVLTSSKQIPETTRYNMIIARITRALFPFNVSPPYRQHNIFREIVQIIYSKCPQHLCKTGFFLEMSRLLCIIGNDTEKQQKHCIYEVFT
jgi:hypothetical protein